MRSSVSSCAGADAAVCATAGLAPADGPACAHRLSRWSDRWRRQRRGSRRARRHLGRICACLAGRPATSHRSRQRPARRNALMSAPVWRDGGGDSSRKTRRPRRSRPRPRSPARARSSAEAAARARAIEQRGRLVQSPRASWWRQRLRRADEGTCALFPQMRQADLGGGRVLGLSLGRADTTISPRGGALSGPIGNAAATGGGSTPGLSPLRPGSRVHDGRRVLRAEDRVFGVRRGDLGPED